MRQSLKTEPSVGLSTSQPSQTASRAATPPPPTHKGQAIFRERTVATERAGSVAWDWTISAKT